MPSYGGRTFEQKLRFLREKTAIPTNGYEDIQRAEHDHAFMVSGANQQALVEDLQNAILAAEESGETVEQFQKRFDQIVAKHGWDYHGSRGWRSRLIYETNMRQAYNAGREAQFADPKFRQAHPYLQYRHSGSENPRPQHQSWDGLVLLADDPWWRSHSPSNGWGCTCKKFAISDRQLQRLGKSGPDTAPESETVEYTDRRTGEVRQVPVGVDPGFDYTPGVSRQRGVTPKYTDLRQPVDPVPASPVAADRLPGTNVTDADLLPDNLSVSDYIDRFVEQFDLNRQSVFEDVQGQPLPVSRLLFADGAGRSAVPESLRRYVGQIVKSAVAPDEIWTQLVPDQANPKRYRLTRRYVRAWRLNGQEFLAVLQYGQGLWSAAWLPADGGLAQAMRSGVRLYSALED